MYYYLDQWILNNSPKKLNIDMEISFENQFLNSKFQNAQSDFHITSTSLVMLIHFIFEEKRILRITYAFRFLSSHCPPGWDWERWTTKRQIALSLECLKSISKSSIHSIWKLDPTSGWDALQEF